MRLFSRGALLCKTALPASRNILDQLRKSAIWASAQIALGVALVTMAGGLALASPAEANQGLPSWAKGRPIHFEPRPGAVKIGHPMRSTGPLGSRSSLQSRIFGEGFHGKGKGPVSYHGGEVALSPAVHVIFWGSPWRENYNDEQVVSQLESLFAHLSGSSYQGIVTQYDDRRGRISSNVSVEYYWDDGLPVEHVEENAIKAEAIKAIKAESWQTGANNIFIVVVSGTYAEGFGTSFCAYHGILSQSETGKERSAYAFVPYQGGGRFEGCGGAEGSEEAINHTVKSVVHEYAEEVTDPFEEGWYSVEEKEVDEIADICNEPIAHVEGLGYVSALWDNHQNECSLSDANPPVQPIKPVAASGSATLVNYTSATLNGSVEPCGTETHYYFEYGPTTSYGTDVPAAGGNAGSEFKQISETASVTGLKPNTTYHYRMVATSSAGTAYGADERFHTLYSPTDETQAASGITQSKATLNGSVNPEGASTTYHFEYGTTPSYGTSVPVPSGELGSGTSSIAAKQTIEGLKEGTEYHYRVTAVNSGGTANGADGTFRTQGPPTVEVEPVTEITTKGARLNGNVIPNGLATSYHFEYGKTTAYGTSAPVPNAEVGSGMKAVKVGQAITGLEEKTTYHYRIVAVNSRGTTYGSDQIFATRPFPPVVATQSASSVTRTSATLNASVNPKGAEVSKCYFEYGPTISYGSSASCSSLPGSGENPVEVSAPITGLGESTTYHYRIVAANAGGINDGSDEVFKTLPYPPTVVTGTASSIESTAATLNGTVNPNDGLVTACTFEYGSTLSYGKSVSCASLPGSGASPVGVSAVLANLSEHTPYYFRLVATNALGTSKGQSQQLVTKWNCSMRIGGSGESLQNVVQTGVWVPASEGCASFSASGFGLELFGVGKKGTPASSGSTFVATDEAPGGTCNTGELQQIEEAAGGSCTAPQALVIPVAETAIAVVVNPPLECSITEITNASLLAVWNGTKGKWSEIASGGGCSGKNITRVVRREVAGATYVVKTYFEEISKGTSTCNGKKWSELAGSARSVEWPENGQAGCSGESEVTYAKSGGDGGEVEEVAALEGSVGYASLPDARAKYDGESGNHYHWIAIENSTKEVEKIFEYPGTDVSEPSEAVAEANCVGTEYKKGGIAVGADDDWSKVNGAHPAGNSHYPICALTYDVALANYTTAKYPKPAEEGQVTKSYLEYVASPRGGQTAIGHHDYSEVEEVVGAFAKEEAKLVG